MVKVNGKETPEAQGMKVLDFLLSKNYKPALIAVELNGSILPKSEYESCIINENDTLEVVSFVGGG